GGVQERPKFRRLQLALVEVEFRDVPKPVARGHLFHPPLRQGRTGVVFPEESQPRPLQQLKEQLAPKPAVVTRQRSEFEVGDRQLEHVAKGRATQIEKRKPAVELAAPLLL